MTKKKSPSKLVEKKFKAGEVLEAYKMGGASCSSDEPECLAKVIRGQENTRIFMIKYGSHTSGVYGPCNPKGLGFQPIHLKAKDSMSGKPFYEFIKADLIAWNLYLDFLKTGNEGYINKLIRHNGV